jgi:hypothetical protein
MPSEWPALPYEEWSETCDTLHAHTQVLGKLAVALASPEPRLRHAALRLTARGWDDVRGSPDPHAFALDFVRSAFRHACLVCDWDPALSASAEGTPPPVA